MEVKSKSYFSFYVGLGKQCFPNTFLHQSHSTAVVTWPSPFSLCPQWFNWFPLPLVDLAPVPGVAGQVVPLAMVGVGGERRSEYSWRASLRALQTLGEGEVVQSTRQGYSWRTSFHTALSTAKLPKQKGNQTSRTLFPVRWTKHQAMIINWIENGKIISMLPSTFPWNVGNTWGGITHRFLAGLVWGISVEWWWPSARRPSQRASACKQRIKLNP